ncbi:MAG: glycosyltransferase family 2 protein, partial [Opitutae bacterium]|nr:glycosyltransferase family 2 protein [Opitutae bacterium]
MSDFAVSVIIPAFNAAAFLECAVASALQQPEVREVVVVDDGSTDATLSVAEKLQAAHPNRVCLFTHPGRANRGPGETRNLGLAQARAPFIAFLDADDWYLPGYFQFDREAFGRDPNLGMVRHPLGNGWNPDDPDQQWFLEYTGKARAQAEFYSRVENAIPDAYFGSLYPMGDVSSGVADTLTIRRSLIDSVGNFPARDWAEDVALHLKLAAVGTVAFADMSEPLAMRRIHADNLSRRKAEELAERIDAMGQTLLELADFAKERRLPWGINAALHRGWIRFGHMYTRHRSYAMLQKWPWALLHPRVLCSYGLLYARTGLSFLARKAGA